MKRYFGFEIADSMFGGGWTTKIVRTVLSVEETRALISLGVEVTFCTSCNKALLDKMVTEYGIAIPTGANTRSPVFLAPGDSIIILDVEYLEWVAHGRLLVENPPTDMAFVEWTVMKE